MTRMTVRPVTGELPRFGPDHDSRRLGQLCAPDSCGYCEAIRAMVADLPPLTDEQVQTVARLLRAR